MSRVEAIYWDQIPADMFPAWVEPSGMLVALWPSPVDHDACFAQAGFTQFGDSDEQWDQEWSRAIGRILHVLESYGPARLQNYEDVFRTSRRD